MKPACLLFSIVFSFYFVMMFSSVSVGQPEEPCGKPWITPLSEVSGEIVNIYFTPPPWTNEEGLHLDIKILPEDNIIVAHVFPKNCIDNNPDIFQFNLGDSVTVIGSEFLTEADTQQNICAAEIVQKSHMKLRTLETGCLNEKLCRNCQGICEEQCSDKPNPTICMKNCIEICESNITPCFEGGNGNGSGYLQSVLFLLL